MLYLPLPVGRVCRECGIWKPRHLLVKNKKQPDGVEKHCLSCNSKRSKQWFDNHPGVANASRSKWRRNNPQKQRDAIKRWHKNNPDKSRALESRWAKNHPDKARAKVRRRDARKRQLQSTFTNEDWKLALDWWHGVCAYCGNPPSLLNKTRVLTQDHFVPVTSGGHYTSNNIVPACKSCNSQKWNLDPAEWIGKRFGKRKAKIILKRIQDYFAWVKSHSE